MCRNSHVLIHSSPKFSEHLYAITLNSLSGRFLIFVLFSYFPEVFSSFVWTIFLCLFILPDSFYVCFYVLGRPTTSPSLEEVALCSWCLMGPRTNFFGHQSQALQECPLWAVCPLPPPQGGHECYRHISGQGWPSSPPCWETVCGGDGPDWCCLPGEWDKATLRGGGFGSNESCLPIVAIQEQHWRGAYEGVLVGWSGSTEDTRVGLAALAMGSVRNDPS